MKIAVLLAILSIAMCYRTTQFENGNEVIVRYATGHILEAQAAVPRQVVIDVKFKKAFQVVPQVFISAQLLDWSAGVPHGFIEKVSDITTTGFKLTGIAVAPGPLYSLFVDWYAIFDPRIAVVAFESTDVQTLKTGQGERVVQYTVEHGLKDATNAIVSLIGVKHITTNPIVEVKVESITPKAVTVSVRSYWQAQLEFVRFNVLIGTDQSLWSGPPQVIYNDPASSHPFVKRAPSAAEVGVTLELPKVWQSGPRLPIVTIRGYDIERARNMRLQYNTVLLESKLTYKVVTWWDTQIYGAFHQAAIYVADTNFKIFDPSCSELFSECDFKGDSITVCDRVPDLPASGWSKPIKSLTVPVNRRLYLFNKENFVGQRTSFITNQQCLNSITFSFAQLQEYNPQEEEPVITSQ